MHRGAAVGQLRGRIPDSSPAPSGCGACANKSALASNSPNGRMLESVPQTHLHYASRLRSLKFSKLGGVVDVQDGIVQVHVVEGIEGLRAKLQPVSLPRKAKGLLERDVEIHAAWEPDNRSGSRCTARLLEIIARSRGVRE